MSLLLRVSASPWLPIVIQHLHVSAGAKSMHITAAKICLAKAYAFLYN